MKKNKLEKKKHKSLFFDSINFCCKQFPDLDLAMNMDQTNDDIPTNQETK